MTLIERLREMRKEPWIYWYLARTCHTEGRGVMGWDETDEMNEQSILRRVAGAVEEATEQLRAENAELRKICRDAYEVWAGSEGIPQPTTASEAYLLQLLAQMRDEVKRGLSAMKEQT